MEITINHKMLEAALAAEVASLEPRARVMRCRVRTPLGTLVDEFTGAALLLLGVEAKIITPQSLIQAVLSGKGACWVLVRRVLRSIHEVEI